MMRNLTFKLLLSVIFLPATWQSYGGTGSSGTGDAPEENISRKPGVTHGRTEPDLSLKTPYFEKGFTEFNGAASFVTGEQIKGVPSSDISNALTGRLPGLITIQSDGEPGFDGADMYIRGRRTNSEGILVLIDGQPGSLVNVQPSDIESITILKDASALALYGMRAANGVMVVTTKRGHDGRMRINVSAQVAYQQHTRKLKRVNSATFAEMYNEAMFNEDPNQTPKYLPEDIQKYIDGSDPVNFPDVDWYGDLMKNGTWVQKYNVDISGGNKNTKYYVALGAQLQSGMFKTDDEFSYDTNTGYDRYNFKSNIDFNPTKTTSVNVGITMRFEKNNYPGTYNSQSAIFNALMQTPPNAFPMYYVDHGNPIDNTGNKVSSVNGKIVAGSAQTTINNPWAMLNRAGYSQSDRRYGVLNINAKQKLDFITRGLALDAHVSTDIYSEQLVIRNKTYANYELMPDGTYTMRGTNGSMDNSAEGTYNTRNTTVDVAVSYARRLGRHDVSGRLFYNMYENAIDYILPTRFIGGGGMLSYSYDSRYSADFTFAIQSSNKFASGDRTVFTPAASFGWLVSNEEFMKGQNVVSYLKLRGSAGKLANFRGIGYYDYLSALTQVNGVMREGIGNVSGFPGYDETKVANPNLTWESSVQWNVGIDAGFLNDRLILSGDYFRDRRSDMYITPSNYSKIIGLSYIPKTNAGKMKSWGYEIALNWTDRIGDFHYSVGGNFTSYDNKVIDMDEPIQPYEHMYKKGHAIDAVFGLVADGFYKNQADIDNSVLPNFANVQPGDIKYVSQTGLPYIDATYDQVKIGHGYTPKVFYGIDLAMEYKGFDLSMLFQGAAKTTRVLQNTMRNTFVGEGSFFDFQLDRWTDENSVNAAYPRLSTTTNINSNRTSTFWLKDSSYFRLKTAEFGYSFNTKICRKMRMEKLRIFFSGYNLAIVKDKVKVIDPEGNANGTGFPAPRIFNIGLNITF